MDPMWLDGLIYLPLICWGVHRLVDEGKLVPYIVPLALMFIAHFYIGYMVGIFTFFYFCWYCLSREGRILPKKLQRSLKLQTEQPVHHSPKSGQRNCRMRHKVARGMI